MRCPDMQLISWEKDERRRNYWGSIDFGLGSRYFALEGMVSFQLAFPRACGRESCL